MATRPSCTQQLVPDLTPVKQQHSHLWDQQQAPCPYGSPVSGLCSSAAASARPFAGSSQSGSNISQNTHSNTVAVRAGSLFGQPQPAANWSAGKSPTATLSWAPGASAPLTSSTSSMPELWQRQVAGQYSAGRQTPDHQPNVADSTPSRDQLLRTSHPQPLHSLQQYTSIDLHPSQQKLPHQPAGGLQQSLSQQQQRGQGVASKQQMVQHQQAAPIDVLLAPLLPSADQDKVVERLSQLRQALEEQRRLAVGWEQQAMSLQQTVSEGQHENLTMRGQLVALQHNINLLGGNLQGRLSLVQGAVLAQLQSQLADKDAAIAGSEQTLASLQSEVERLNCRFASKLAAEQSERERLSAEASQARLLCQARGRQLTELQQELQHRQQTAANQQQKASAGAELQQQQLEQLHQKVQQLEQELSAAQRAAAYAAQQVSAGEGGRMGLKQQVDELQSALAEKHLQVEWLEGKIADLENSDMASQMKRHSAEVSRLQAAAAAERQAAEQQLCTLRSDLAALQQQEQQREQQLQSLEQDNAMLREQVEQQQQAADEQISELQRLLQQAEADVQQLQAELQVAAGAAAAQAAADQDSSWQQQQQQHDALAAAMASDSEETDNVHDRLVICHQEGLTIMGDTAQSRPTTPAAAAMEHALRAELGMANAEVARLQHELDVARTAGKEERQLTGAEIMRLQQELSEAAASASSAGAAGAAGEDEVTSQLPNQQQQLEGGRISSSNSWHSLHENRAFEQQQQQQQQQGCVAATGDTAPAAVAADLVSQYEGRLQDQSQTIASLQQQLKQQQQLLATLQKPERRVHDSAASRSSWVDMLGPDEDTRHHLVAAAAAAAAGQQLFKPLVVAADAAVQTDSSSTESAGSTAAIAAADDDQVEFMSPRHPMSKQQQQAAAGAGDVWCEGAAGSALLSAARQEIQRLQELTQQLLESHAEDMKSSVSFEAARRALIEAKSHAKSKAAAVLQANNKAWQDKLTAAKVEQQQLMQQMEELTQQRDQLQTQVATSCQYESAVGHLQQQLDASQVHIHQLQRQIADMAEQHAQELEQVRLELETEAAAAMLDAGAAAVRRSMQQQQERREAAVQVVLQMQPLLLDTAVQTDQQQCQLWHSEVMVVQQVLQQQSNPADIAEAKQQQQQQQDTHHLHQQQEEEQHGDKDGPSAADRPQHQRQQELPAASLPAERPATPQPAPAPPAAAAAAAPTAAAAAGLGAATDSHMAAAALTPPIAAAARSAAATTATAVAARSATATTAATAAAGSAAATAATPAAAYVQQWQQQHAADAADDDMCRMSSASDTPASHSSRVQISRMPSSGSLPRQPAAAAAAGVSSSSEFGDCSSNYKCCDEGASCASRSGGVGSRPSSAGTGKLPELQTSSSPIAASSNAALLLGGRQPLQPLQVQDCQQEQRDQTIRQQQQHAGVGSSSRLNDWHVQLLQQQAQLDQLRLRLSQHKTLTTPPQQQQQQQRKFGGVSSFLDRQVSPQRSAAAGSVLGNSSSAGRGAAGSAAAGVGYSRPVCAAAAAAGAAAAALASSAGAEFSLLEPVAGGSSPLTWTQRRQQRQQQEQYALTPGAGTWNPTPTVCTNPAYEATPSSSSSGYGAVGADSVASTAAAAAGTASAPHAGLGQYALQYGTADTRYTSTETWQTEDRVLTGDSAVLTHGVRRTYINSLYQEHDAGLAAAGDGSAGSMFTLGHAAAVGGDGGGGTSSRRVLPTPLTAINAPIHMTTDVTAEPGLGSSSRRGDNNLGAVGFEGVMHASNHSPGSDPAVNGLDKIHDDVMGALSLSRYHRERSKQQEARAKQHAMNAQDALDKAAAVRSSRLSGAGSAAGAASGSNSVSATSFGQYGSSRQ